MNGEASYAMAQPYVSTPDRNALPRCMTKGEREVECRVCDGTGKVTIETDVGDRQEPCATCEGSGRVTMAVDEDWDT